MATQVITHDEVTGACALAELVPYPTVVGTGATTVTTNVAADGTVTYVVHSAGTDTDTFATYNPTTRTITFADGQTVVLPADTPNPVVVGSTVTSAANPDGTVVYTVAETPNPTVSATVGGGASVTQTTNPDGSINYAVSASGIDGDSCYVIPEITDACNVVEVGYVVNAAGCGHLVQITEQPLPRGFQYVTESINGANTVVFSGNAGDRSARLEATWNTGGGANPAVQFYEIFDTPALVTLSTNDFCGLNTAGTPLRAVANVNMGYYMSQANIIPRNIGPYQFGAAIAVDGVIMHMNRDSYALDQSGFNSFVADIRRANFTTTGNNMTVEVIPFVRVDTGLGSYDPTDQIDVDMGEIAITWEKV